MNGGGREEEEEEEESGLEAGVHPFLGAVYTIDHELVPHKMPYSAVRVHGVHFMVQVLKKLIYKAVGPLTRCKPNVDQEE